MQWFDYLDWILVATLWGHVNAKVHPLVVVLVIFLTFLAIGVWVWGSGEAKSIGGPAELKTGPDGHLYIQIQNQLLEHDADGVFIERHDLAELDVDQLLGGIAFFSDGDILLRRGPDARTLSQNIRAYQRQTNDQSLTPVSPDSGLYRCDLDTTKCELFGSGGIDFKAAHSIFIDWPTDEVYIADTTRHLLRKYSSSGDAVAEPAAGFKFPNQLLMHEGALYVVNTNYHQIRKVDPRTVSFGEELESFDVRSPVALAARQTWPSHMARVGDQWWVNNMRNNMSEGGIYVFDDDWSYDRTVSLPPDADPISLLPFRGEVLISDWNNDRVYRVSSAGDLLNDFASTGLEQVLAESRSKRLQFQIYSFAGIGLFVFVLAGLVVRILATNSPARAIKESTAQIAKRAVLSDDTVRLEPDPKTARKTRVAMRIVFLLVIISIAALAFLVVFSGQIRIGLQLLLPTAGLVGICVLIAWINRVNTGTSICIRGDTVTLRDHTGRESTCPIKDVLYDHTAIATPDLAVFLGQPQMPIYDRQILENQVFPRLANARHVSIWTMQLTLFRVRHPQGLTAAFALFGLLSGGAWMLIQASI